MRTSCTALIDPFSARLHTELCRKSTQFVALIAQLLLFNDVTPTPVCIMGRKCDIKRVVCHSPVAL